VCVEQGGYGRINSVSCYCGDFADTDNALCSPSDGLFCYQGKCNANPICQIVQRVAGKQQVHAACVCGDDFTSGHPTCAAGEYCKQNKCSAHSLCDYQDGVRRDLDPHFGDDECVCGDDFASGHPNCVRGTPYCGNNICKSNPICPHQNGQVSEGPCWCGGGFGAGVACTGANPFCSEATCYPSKTCIVGDGSTISDEACACGPSDVVDPEFDKIEFIFGDSKFTPYCEIQKEYISANPKCEAYKDGKNASLFDIESCTCFLDNGSQETCESTKAIMEITYSNDYTISGNQLDTPTCELYSSRSDGRKNCVRSRNYPEPFHENDSCAVEFIKSGTLRVKDMKIESKMTIKEHKGPCPPSHPYLEKYGTSSSYWCYALPGNGEPYAK